LEKGEIYVKVKVNEKNITKEQGQFQSFIEWIFFLIIGQKGKTTNVVMWMLFLVIPVPIGQHRPLIMQ
jgi:hypothetical protein